MIEGYGKGMIHRHIRQVVLTSLCIVVFVLPLQDAAAFENAVFGPISVEGNTSTRTDLILHELGFAQGDTFDFKALDASWEHLEDLGWFAFVDMDYDNSEGDMIPVTVVVEEDRTTRYYPVIDYDPRWEILLGARIYDINFRGRGETLSFAATWWRRHGYELDWHHPWLFGIKGLSCGVDMVWEDADFVFLDFDYNRHEVSGRLRWDFRSPFFVETGVTYHSFEQQTATAELPATHVAASRNRITWRGTVGVDSRDSVWYPTRGIYSRLSVELVDRPTFYETYTLLTGDLRGFVPLPWDHVLAMRAWGRRVDDALWPEDMLFWGGADTIRGYEYASIAGEEGFLLSVEYRWPIFLMPISGDGRVIGIGLHAFGDAGANWWNDQTDDTLFSYGGGAHINISDHQFRFELAITADDDVAFQFMDAFNF